MVTWLVDAENVRRSLWPNLPPERLVELCRGWAEREGVRIAVVFDGAAPGGLVGERALDERCTLVGAGSAGADDRIAALAAELRETGTAFALVTSDGALRARAGGGAEPVVGGGRFARELTGEA